MKKITFISLLWVCFTGCQTKPYEGITIATAANMQFAMQALTKAFKQKFKIDCRVVVGSSGKLTAQIKEGAPYQVLVSADMKYPQTLYKAGLSSAPKTYAWGKLVLWTQKPDLKLHLGTLTQQGIRHLAIANPKTAPYGAAAVAVLKQQGVYDQIKPKLVYGESIAQTNQFIISQTADVGFTAKAVVLSPRLKNKGKWIDIAPTLYPPIAQGIAVILPKGKQHKVEVQRNLENAKAFEKFLFTPAAQHILQQYGYTTRSLVK
ncbi:molybdate ABC transporter substrate-binding protein [Microscilla marina]|uniref:Molybdate ABC transporter, periplasmic molybdate-binding protein n=1 Tax=Microscilla marina ATCC 23134 TaxID=313606 RepID=A1ZQ07_MICM2|nr:molybdate ABC transporter substrate-binding protein [Microscilla marina]EAY27416.1 molybdate ABC transporter, periplasmic molybdate-binding protein [Microscilla marina ATCC 23134]